MTGPPLAEADLRCLRSVAAALLPGSATSPAPADVPELDALLCRAAAAIGRELPDLKAAIDVLGPSVTWARLELLCRDDPASFELISSVVAGAYFMSSTVLDSIGYRPGTRTPPPFDLAADELETGILDPVQARGSRVRKP